MKRTFKILGSIIIAIAMTLSLAVSSYAECCSPTQVNDFAYDFTVTGSSTASSTFKVTSSGNVKITGKVIFELQPHTPAQTVSAYVYIYDANGNERLKLWLDTSTRSNNTDHVLTSLPYTNSRTISLPVGTYTVTVETSGATDNITSKYTVIFA